MHESDSSSPMTNLLRVFGTTAVIEGISYLLLLGVAMPLKYFFNLPMAVKIVGWAHGVLFVAYMALLALCWLRYRLPFTLVLWCFVAALLPVVPFFVERRVKRHALSA